MGIAEERRREHRTLSSSSQLCLRSVSIDESEYCFRMASRRVLRFCNESHRDSDGSARPCSAVHQCSHASAMRRLVARAKNCSQHGENVAIATYSCLLMRRLLGTVVTGLPLPLLHKVALRNFAGVEVVREISAPVRDCFWNKLASFDRKCP